MIPNDQMQGIAAKPVFEFAQAFGGACKGRRIAQTDECRIGGVIAIDYNMIRRFTGSQKTFELRTACKRVTHPDEMPVGSCQQPNQWSRNGPQFVIAAPGTLGLASVMNVAQNDQSHGT